MRSPRVLTLLLRVLAAVVLGGMLAGALSDVSQAWDVWYYHLPFAARLAGVVPASSYVFHAANEARFAGFPLVAEMLQGLLWRVTGRAESANLVALASVPLLAWFLVRRFGVPWHLGVLGLLAIPLVHTHATSCYVDLPANAAASVLLLLAVEVWATEAPVSARTLGLGGMAAAVAANMKPMLHPIVLLGLAAIALRAVPPLVRELRTPSRARAAKTLAAIAVALPIVFATPLKNAALHGNPYYPVRVTLLGHALPGPEEPYASSPVWLEDAPRPARFAASLLEIGLRPFTSPRRWTVDQWMASDARGFRMGGFFGVYVLAHLALLAWRTLRERSRKTRAAGVAFALVTAVTAVLPQSHELRYYLYWMIVLVSLNLWLVCREEALPSLVGPLGIGVLSAVALAVVLAVTRCGYAYPSGSSFTDFVHRNVDEGVLATVHDGDRVCVQREPFNLLWAPAFHPPRRYVVKEAERAEDCKGYRTLE